MSGLHRRLLKMASDGRADGSSGPAGATGTEAGDPVTARVLHALERLRRPRAISLGTGVLALAASTPELIYQHDRTARASGWWAVLLGLSACVALLWMRRRPGTVAVVCLSCTTAQAALGFLLGPLLLAPSLVALYLLSYRADGRSAWTITAAAVVVLVGTTVILGPSDAPIGLRTISVAAWLLLPTALGSASRTHVAYLEAAHARVDDAERTREEEARNRVLEERLRIARDLHDVVAHHLALANAQAGAVVHLLDAKPDDARQLATELTTTTSSALRELKNTVGLLRHGDTADLPLQPAPGLDRLGALAESCEAAGLTVVVTSSGVPRSLSPTVDLTAFRIIQEALTNVTKHAETTRATVQIDYLGDVLRVDILNESTVPYAPSTTPGYGLIGMTERAHAVGGRLEAGPRDGGWEVSAELPLGPAPSHHESVR